MYTTLTKSRRVVKRLPGLTTYPTPEVRLDNNTATWQNKAHKAHFGRNIILNIGKNSEYKSNWEPRSKLLRSWREELVSRVDSIYMNSYVTLCNSVHSIVLICTMHRRFTYYFFNGAQRCLIIHKNFIPGDPD